jgi:hypothetical protein
MMTVQRLRRVNPGAALVIGAVVAMICAAALQSTGLLLFGIAVLVGSLAYRSMRSAETRDMVEPRHLDLSWPKKLAILLVFFALFALLAWIGSR